MDQQEIVNFAAYGIDRMIADLENKRGEIRQMQQAPAIAVKHQRGRPAKALLAAVNSATAKTGWSADPGERKREMARRQAKRTANRKKSSAQTRWKNSTPAERKKWLQAMQAGARKKKRREQAGQATDNARRAVEQHRKQQPVVKLEATA